MEFCDINKFEELIGRQNQIIPYLMSLREKKLSYNSISTRLNAIYHFYDMNDVSLNKKKIKMFKGEYIRKVVDRAYTREEIKKILDVSDLRSKTIVLLMASSGIRIGALPDIKIRNLEKINNIYKITVYEGSSSEYFTFGSPECTSYIDAYLDFRTINGEDLIKDSYLIREQFDISDLEQIKNKSKGMSISGIESLLSVILLKSGVRVISHSQNRILVAVDGSENSKRAGNYAIKLGLELHADITTLHVVPAGKHFPEENLEKGTKHDYAYLDKIGEQSIYAGVDLEIEIIRAQSSVIDEIIKYAEKKNIDLIVIGIRSVSEFRFMLGSTATGVVVNATCPVLVVK
jgi:nucleotide-binding universal stress UspA family protein